LDYICIGYPPKADLVQHAIYVSRGMWVIQTFVHLLKIVRFDKLELQNPGLRILLSVSGHSKDDSTNGKAENRIE